jgi:hypothetical protein
MALVPMDFRAEPAIGGEEGDVHKHISCSLESKFRQILRFQGRTKGTFMESVLGSMKDDEKE